MRLQSDERLIAMTRRGQHAAFEVLFARYQSRLLAFCRHMLTSREDAEDVLQEVFTAAFNAVLADDREINVRPWLYRIARNRSLNHLRRASAIGVDSMDVHYADNGLSTGERVLRRESFRLLLGDVKDLPETQRTALLLREIDALSYEQIAAAMETTVPSVKSLLVRARISLAEAAEARELSCAQVREQLGEVAEGLTKLSAPARRHMRGCRRCQTFKRHLRANNHALAAIFPVGTLLLVKKLLLTKLGSTASAGHVGASATAGAGAGATVSAGAGGAGVSGGLLTAGAGAVATKAAAGLAAAAIVTAGAVAAEHSSPPAHRHRAPVATASAVRQGEPVVVHTAIQPVTSERTIASAVPQSGHGRRTRAGGHPTAGVALANRQASETAGGAQPVKPADPPAATQVVEVTTDMTQLPPSATGAPLSQPSAVAAPATPATDPTGGTLSPPAESGSPAPTTPDGGPVTASATQTSSTGSSTATGSTQTSPTSAAGAESSSQSNGPAQTTETGASEPATAEATATEPAAEGDTAESGASEPASTEAAATESTEEPAATEPTEEAGTTEAGAGEPAATEATTTEAVAAE